MACDNNTVDNRESCVELTPSSCVPYTGYISETIKEDIVCRPNINDIFKKLQDLIDKINLGLGDNTTLDDKCLTIDELTVKQSELNQIFINEICEIKTLINNVDGVIDPNTIMLIVNLLCLQEPGCPPATSYSLQEIIVKLITAYCDLLTRVQNIETILNI